MKYDPLIHLNFKRSRIEFDKETYLNKKLGRIRLFYIVKKKHYLNYWNLLPLGLQIGDEASKFNPKAIQFTIAKRNDVHIMDLEKFLISIRMLRYETSMLLLPPSDCILFASEDPAIDFNLRMATQKHANLLCSSNKWIRGTLTNFKQNVIEFARVLRFVSKQYKDILKIKIGRPGLRKMPILSGLHKKFTKFPSLMVSFSENYDIRAEAFQTVTSLFFVSTGSTLKYKSDYELPLNMKGLSPKMFILSYFKEIAHAIRIRMTLTGGRLPSWHDISNPIMPWKVYNWEWMKRMFVWKRANQSANFKKRLKYMFERYAKTKDRARFIISARNWYRRGFQKFDKFATKKDAFKGGFKKNNVDNKYQTKHNFMPQKAVVQDKKEFFKGKPNYKDPKKITNYQKKDQFFKPYTLPWKNK